MLKKYPLTTLLLVATLCVDAVVLWFASQGGDQATSTALWLYLAQAGLLSLWLVHGKTEFWVRVVCSLAFLSLAFWVPFDEEGKLVTHAAIYMMFVFILAGIVQLFLRRGSAELSKASGSREKPQFSVAHLLLLMTALALLFSYVRITHTQTHKIIFLATAAVVPVAMYRLLWQTHRKLFRFTLFMVVAIVWSILQAWVIDIVRSNQTGAFASSVRLFLLMNQVVGATVAAWLVVVEHEFSSCGDTKQDLVATHE